MSLIGPFTQNRFLQLLTREIKYAGDDPNMFSLDKRVAYDNLGDTYRVTCKECNHLQEQVMCDWSDGYKVDNLIDMVIDFVKSHRHPKPVDLAGSFEQPDAELPTRFFRRD